MEENRSQGARRCLFGRANLDTLSQDLAEELNREEKASVEKFEKRWNFKLEGETPLPGRFKWEKIECDPAKQSTSRSMSHLPPSPVPNDPLKYCLSPTKSLDGKDWSLSEGKSNLSSASTTSNAEDSQSMVSPSEKDVNENIVTRGSVKRKVCEEKKDEGVKRSKPP